MMALAVDSSNDLVTGIGLGVLAAGIFSATANQPLVEDPAEQTEPAWITSATRSLQHATKGTA